MLQRAKKVLLVVLLRNCSCCHLSHTFPLLYIDIWCFHCKFLRYIFLSFSLVMVLLNHLYALLAVAGATSSQAASIPKESDGISNLCTKGYNRIAECCKKTPEPSDPLYDYGLYGYRQRECIEGRAASAEPFRDRSNGTDHKCNSPHQRHRASSVRRLLRLAREAASLLRLGQRWT